MGPGDLNSRQPTQKIKKACPTHLIHRCTTNRQRMMCKTNRQRTGECGYINTFDDKRRHTALPVPSYPSPPLEIREQHQQKKNEKKEETITKKEQALRSQPFTQNPRENSTSLLGPIITIMFRSPLLGLWQSSQLNYLSIELSFFLTRPAKFTHTSFLASKTANQRQGQPSARQTDRPGENLSLSFVKECYGKKGVCSVLCVLFFVRVDSQRRRVTWVCLSVWLE